MQKMLLQEEKKNINVYWKNKCYVRSRRRRYCVKVKEVLSLKLAVTLLMATGRGAWQSRRTPSDYHGYLTSNPMTAKKESDVVTAVRGKTGVQTVRVMYVEDMVQHIPPPSPLGCKQVMGISLTCGVSFCPHLPPS